MQYSVVKSLSKNKRSSKNKRDMWRLLLPRQSGSNKSRFAAVKILFIFVGF